MSKDDFIPFNKIMEETKKNDPESHSQIVEEANKEVENMTACQKNDVVGKS
mgnify:CR=1 FL=1